MERAGCASIRPRQSHRNRIEVGFTDSLFDGLGAEWGLAAPSLFLHQMQLYWDSLNARWNDWILGYGPDKQNQFMQLLGMDDPTWRKMFLTLVIACIALVLLVSGILMLRYRPPKPDRAGDALRQVHPENGCTTKTRRDTARICRTRQRSFKAAGGNRSMR